MSYKYIDHVVSMSHYTYWLSDILEADDTAIYLVDTTTDTATDIATDTTTTIVEKEIQSKNKVSAIYNKENNVENQNGYEFLP